MYITRLFRILEQELYLKLIEKGLILIKTAK